MKWACDHTRTMCNGESGMEKTGANLNGDG